MNGAIAWRLPVPGFAARSLVEIVGCPMRG